MTTLFEDWLKGTQFKMPAQAQQSQQGVTPWAYTPTVANAPAAPDKGGRDRKSVV